MPKEKSLQSILREIDQLSFKQLNLLRDAATALHALKDKPEHQQHRGDIDLILRWFTVAHTLRPIDFKGVAEHVCELLVNGKSLPEQITAALGNLTTLPPDEVRKHINAKEAEVQKGDYDSFITQSARDKYALAQAELLDDASVHECLAGYRRRNPEFSAEKKLRRRILAMERNFKSADFYFEPTPKGLALLDLEAICYDHHLFGVEDFGTTPLLQKLSVNATAHGVLIFIPRWWSLDYRRDFNWPEITKLLTSWGIPKQGATIAQMRKESEARAKALAKAYAEAGRKGKQGIERQNYAATKAGFLRGMDERQFYRILKQGKALLATEKESKKND